MYISVRFYYIKFYLFGASGDDIVVSTDRGFDLEPPWRLDLDGKLGCPVPSSLVNFRVYGRYIGGIAIDIE